MVECNVRVEHAIRRGTRSAGNAMLARTLAQTDGTYGYDG